MQTDNIRMVLNGTIGTGEAVTFTGGKFGTHTITRTTEAASQWAKRVDAHWIGYLESNGSFSKSVAR